MKEGRKNKVCVGVLGGGGGFSTSTSSSSDRACAGGRAKEGSVCGRAGVFGVCVAHARTHARTHAHMHLQGGDDWKAPHKLWDEAIADEVALLHRAQRGAHALHAARPRARAAGGWVGRGVWCVMCGREKRASKPRLQSPRPRASLLPTPNTRASTHAGALPPPHSPHWVAKADGGCSQAVRHQPVQSNKRAAADEEYVGCVHLDELAARVLAAFTRVCLCVGRGEVR